MEQNKSQAENAFGFILINKPSGPTSHDMVDKLRKITGIRKIGHAGTLDPFASGLLIMAIGRAATREISKFVKLGKEYVAKLQLGASSDTYDRTGEIRAAHIAQPISQDEVQNVITRFIGKQKQVPPMYSAKKINGKKLYELARQGKTVERQAVEVEIYEIKFLKYKWPLLSFGVKCSSGTYIRSLGHDIGESLDCGAYLVELKRTAIGDYSLSQAIDIKKLKPDNWQNYLL